VTAVEQATPAWSWERELVGMALRRPVIVDRLTVVPDHFCDAALGALWHVTQQVVGRSDTVDVGVLHLLDQLNRDRWRVRMPGGMPPVIVPPMLPWEVYEAATLAATPEFVAERVVKAALIRRMRGLGSHVEQASRDGVDYDDALDQAARTGLQLCTLADDGPGGVAPGLLAVDAVPSAGERRELLPELIARQDRLIVVGDEGAGKMVLLRLLAVCLAAGIHPFRGTRCPPGRALIIDLENPRHVAEESLAWIGRLVQARTREPLDWSLLRRQYLPDGLNIREPADARHVEAALREVQPDLVVLGPIYKAYRPGRDDAETAAVEAQRLLDRWRTRYDFGLLLEAHAPMEQMGKRYRRPYGSGAWSRWPEFGLSMVPASEVDPRFGEQSDDPMAKYFTQRLGRFRGDRYPVVWPRTISRHGQLVFAGEYGSAAGGAA
jgi:replicative DNA helicase